MNFLKEISAKAHLSNFLLFMGEIVYTKFLNKPRVSLKQKLGTYRYIVKICQITSKNE